MAVDLAVFVRLAELFRPRATLYAVGGFCRDKVLGLEPRDLDICSKLTVKEVESILLNTEFTVHRQYPRLGTACISARGFRAEYTCFRTDSYRNGSGEHHPEDVVFTDDITLDAARRDFTANAVYFDPLTERYTDPTGGMEDISRRLLRAADDPERVFSEDGLRILRLVRFAAETGFETEEETLRAAEKFAPQVADIVPERILAELDKIFVADTAYPALGVADGHARGLALMDRLGLVELLLPELAALKGLEQNPKYHRYDAYRHSVEAYAAAAPRIRWAALLHDVGKRICFERDGNMYGHAEAGAETLAVRLSALRMPKARAKRIIDLVRYHMTDLAGDMSENKLRRFAAEHADLVRDLAALKRADGYATCGHPVEKVRLEEIYDTMLSDGTPMKISDLPVDGKDAEAAGLVGHDIGVALRELWECAVLDPALRRRESALAFLGRRAEKARKEKK